MSPSVRLLLFSTAKEAVGRSEIRRPVPATGLSAGDLVARLIAEYPALRPVLRASRLVLNGEYVEASARVRAGDELAVHPPYSGG